VTKELDESWQRFPEARMRMREQDLATLIQALKPGGMFISGNPRVELLDDGILISMCTNAGKHGKLIALPIDIFIPCDVTGGEAATEESPSPVEEAQEAAT
jgi:hypothetical protein